MKKKSVNIFYVLLTIISSVSCFSQSGNNWMSYLPDSKYVSRVTIPGTHDTGSIRNQDVANSYPEYTYITQDLTYREQLDAGVRFLDIRLSRETFNGGDPRIVHGTRTQFNTFLKGDVLSTIKSFLSANPREVILLSLKKDDGDLATLVNQINTIMNSTEYSSLFYTGNSLPTLGQVRGKIIVLDRMGGLVKGIRVDIPDGTHGASAGTDIRAQDYYDLGVDSCWTGSCDRNKDRKWSVVTTYLNECNSTNSNILYLNFVSGYTGIWWSGGYIPDIVEVSDYMNPRIEDYFRNKIETECGVVILDRVYSTLLDKVYMSNFPGATVYKDCNYGGYAVSLSVGSYTLSQLQAKGVLNDDISSLKVSNDYEVILYYHDNFSGSSIFVGDNDTCLVDNNFNDVVSSLIVRARAATKVNNALEKEVSVEPKEALVIYPNPVENTLNFKTDLKNSTIQIIDFQRVIYLDLPVFDNKSIDVSSLKPGIYAIVLENEGQKTTKKFVKK